MRKHNSHFYFAYLVYDFRNTYYIVVRTQDGHKRSGNKGDRCNTWYTDQRLHVQVFVGQGDGVFNQLTESINAAAEFSIPSGTGKLRSDAWLRQRYHLVVFCCLVVCENMSSDC